MIRRITMAAAVAALALGAVTLPATAEAGGCDDVLVTTPGPVYVEIRGNGDQWIYLENGLQDGLQRGGSGGATGLSSTDPCQQANADQMIF